MSRRNATHEFFSPMNNNEFQNLLLSFLGASHDDNPEVMFEPLNYRERNSLRNLTNLTFSVFNDITRTSLFPFQNSLYEKRHQDREYNIANRYFIENVKKNKLCDYVSITLLNIILDLKKDNLQLFPTSDQLVEAVFNMRCQCVYFASESNIKPLILDYISEKADVPNCREYETLLEFHILHKRLPSDEELEDYTRRTADFFINPEDFHQKDKIRIPTLNIDKLPITQYDGGSCSTCSLCQEDFIDKQNVITLQPCNHHFHYDKKDCLDTASIITWIEQNNFCPLCKTKIEVKL